MRDLSGVVQGMLTTKLGQLNNKIDLIKLWLHESLRIFHDRLINEGDRLKFCGYLVSQLKDKFEIEDMPHDRWRDNFYTDFMTGGKTYELQRD